MTMEHALYTTSLAARWVWVVFVCSQYSYAMHLYTLYSACYACTLCVRMLSALAGIWRER